MAHATDVHALVRAAATGLVELRDEGGSAPNVRRRRRRRRVSGGCD